MTPVRSSDQRPRVLRGLTAQHQPPGDRRLLTAASPRELKFAARCVGRQAQPGGRSSSGSPSTKGAAQIRRGISLCGKGSRLCRGGVGARAGCTTRSPVSGDCGSSAAGMSARVDASASASASACRGRTTIDVHGSVRHPVSWLHSDAWPQSHSWLVAPAMQSAGIASMAAMHSSFVARRSRSMPSCYGTPVHRSNRHAAVTDPKQLAGTSRVRHDR